MAVLKAPERLLVFPDVAEEGVNCFAPIAVGVAALTAALEDAAPSVAIIRFVWSARRGKARSQQSIEKSVILIQFPLMCEPLDCSSRVRFHQADWYTSRIAGLTSGDGLVTVSVQFGGEQHDYTYGKRHETY